MPSRRKSLREVFGLNVRLERTRLGITQEELAGRVQTDQGYVSQIERGAVSPSLDIVERFSRALAVTPAALLDEDLGRK
ncbi:helix-turn-helix domain-containing protein [Hydrocarboniphaga effusa]|uniref:helix-turn-helix domain-containing protein n=1 Tax=Hydrocarboniphaga effusa TaxID=243629 RepID=UPI003BAD1012